MLKAGDIMTTDVITLSPKESVQEGVRLIVSNSISGAPVVVADGKVVGIVTEYDLILAMTTVGSDVDLGEIMKKDCTVVSKGTPIEDIAEMIVTKRLKSFPVVDGDGKLLGVVSRRDVLTNLIG